MIVAQHLLQFCLQVIFLFDFQFWCLSLAKCQLILKSDVFASILVVNINFYRENTCAKGSFWGVFGLNSLYFSVFTGIKTKSINKSSVCVFLYLRCTNFSLLAEVSHGNSK